MKIRAFWRKGAFAALLALGLAVQPVAAQVTTIDPNDAIDADLAQPESSTADAPSPPLSYEPDTSVPGDPATATSAPPLENYSNPAQPAAESNTYQKDDLIGAAEGVFGKGAEGLAGIIENILRDQGEPNGYIVGREAGGAIILGVRYGSGTLFHKVEGEQKVYWTGPSVGIDAGANASNSFVLVYNLYDTEELYKRYGAGEGGAYLVGGFTASYLRRKDVVLIPVRLGVGLRLGANVGYMKFSKNQRWLPF